MRDLSQGRASDCCSASLQSVTVLSFSICLTQVQQVMGPQLYSAMSFRSGISKRVCGGDGVQQPVRSGLESRRKRHAEDMRLPQPYCLVIPRVPLRYPLQPRICNMIIVPDNGSLLVEHIVKKN